MHKVLLICSVLLFSCVSQPDNVSVESACYQEYLVYISKASGNFDIYKNDLKGTETRLTDNPSWDWSPMWNQASGLIVYYSYVNDTFRIRSMNLEGTLKPLDSKGLEEFNLSPDGKTLVMEESREAGRQLVLLSLDDLSRQPITDSLYYNGRAKWSPDSRKLAYISNRDGNNEVYLYDLESGLEDRLTNNSTSEKYLTWGPDSRRIAYTTEYYEEGSPDRNEVFVMDLSNKTTTQITKNSFEDSEIAWSLSGDRIAFHSLRDSIDHIFTMNTDGSDVRQITTQSAYHGEPQWVRVEVECK